MSVDFSMPDAAYASKRTASHIITVCISAEFRAVNKTEITTALAMTDARLTSTRTTRYFDARYFPSFIIKGHKMANHLKLGGSLII